MFCHVCGKALIENAKYCSYCGAKIEIPSENSERKIEALFLGKKKIEKDKHESESDFLKKIAMKIGTGFVYLIGFACIAIAGAIGREIVKEPGAGRVVSYVLPGLLLGIVLSAVTIFISDVIKINYNKSHIFLIFSINVICGIIGGISFVFISFIIINFIAYVYKSNSAH